MAVCVPLNAEIFQMSSAVNPEPQPETLTKGIDLVNKENATRFNLMHRYLAKSCKSGEQ